MTIKKPYRRTVRPFLDGRYKRGHEYIFHPDYALDADHYLRAFSVIQKDMLELFDFIEPADENCGAFSFRIHELIMRVCVEVEANFTAILAANEYDAFPRDNWKMRDYQKIEASHRLSSYVVHFPLWRGDVNLRQPFKAWATPQPRLQWYQNYNAAKHDRNSSFHLATFGTLLDAVSGLVVVLSSQFLNSVASPGGGFLALEGPRDGFDDTFAGYYRVGYPKDWPEADRYEFNWQTLQKEVEPFQQFTY